MFVFTGSCCVFHQSVMRFAGGMRHVTHNDLFFTNQLIEERRFAHIWFADNTNTNRLCFFRYWLWFSFTFFKQIIELVQKVTDVATILCRDRNRFSQTELIPLL